MKFEETVSASSTTNYTLLQWGTRPNELGLIAHPDEKNLDDARFHWKITNPFDAIIYKYPDVISNSEILYDFNGPYEFGLKNLFLYADFVSILAYYRLFSCILQKSLIQRFVKFIN